MHTKAKTQFGHPSSTQCRPSCLKVLVDSTGDGGLVGSIMPAGSIETFATSPNTSLRIDTTRDSAKHDHVLVILAQVCLGTQHVKLDAHTMATNMKLATYVDLTDCYQVTMGAMLADNVLKPMPAVQQKNYRNRSFSWLKWGDLIITTKAQGFIHPAAEYWWKNVSHKLRYEYTNKKI